MSTLTKRQQQILEFIQSQLAKTGIPPTQSEIAQHFRFASLNGVRGHLQAIERKGYIELRSHSSRGIRVLRTGTEPAAPDHRLPLLGRIAAGQPLLAPQHIDDWLDIAPGAFRPKADFLHRVSGHSMREAHILDGDIVAIQARSTADSGTIVAAVITDRQADDAITLKRYFRKGNHVVLRSENHEPGYEPIEIDLSQHDPESQERPPFWIAGVCVGVVRLKL